MTLTIGFSLLDMSNPNAGCVLTPANDLRWDRHDRVPTSAPSALKRPLFAPLPIGKDWLQCVSKGDGHPRF